MSSNPGYLDPHQRHDYILKTYILNRSSYEKSRRQKRDIDVIKDNHKFLWDDDDVPETWESRLARKYYEKLFKEYCIADLSRFKESKIAMRWRTEQEVVSGKGQFQCGSRQCMEKEELRSWEVNFGYLEQGVKKNALVKLRLCVEHSKQLNYTSRKREIKRQKRFVARKAIETKRIKHNKNDTVENDRCYKSADIATQEEYNKSEVTTENNKADQNSLEDGTLVASEDIWSKKPEIESETVTRETEFECYLEDLLL